MGGSGRLFCDLAGVVGVLGHPDPERVGSGVAQSHGDPTKVFSVPQRDAEIGVSESLRDGEPVLAAGGRHLQLDLRHARGAVEIGEVRCGRLRVPVCDDEGRTDRRPNH